MSCPKRRKPKRDRRRMRIAEVAKTVDELVDKGIVETHPDDLDKPRPERRHRVIRRNGDEPRPWATPGTVAARIHDEGLMEPDPADPARYVATEKGLEWARHNREGYPRWFPGTEQALKEST
jgi:hypothetical protein